MTWLAIDGRVFAEGAGLWGGGDETSILPGEPVGGGRVVTASNPAMRTGLGGTLALEGLAEGDYRIETAGSEAVTTRVLPGAATAASLTVP